MPRPSRSSSSSWRFRSLLAASTLALSAVTPWTAMAQTDVASSPNADQLWADFCHYVLIASPQLASEAATALLEADSSILLDAVESSDRNANNIFQRTSRMGELKSLGAGLEKQIQEARIDRSREEDRIGNDIALLSQGQRAYANATQRLASAGQYAAPQLLATLANNDLTELHPSVMSALADIGRPMVLPLAAALPKLNPATQGQVARVLADIGYPQALPALKEIIENPESDPTARAAAQAASHAIGKNARISPDLDAAELYLRLGLGAYDTATDQPSALDGYDAATHQGVAWYYDPALTVTGQPGLVPIMVPGAVLGDVQAMQAARSALALNPSLDSALSLYVMANLRRENRLPEGETDPSYPASRQSPAFYAMVAGPRRLNDVLDVALTDNDAKLALDAIHGLSATASIDALQPLVRGLAFPNSQVRFHAASALARALPQDHFSSDFRVVPILSDAIRQTGAPLALVIATDQPTRNRLVGSADSLNHRAMAAESVAVAAQVIAETPGIDLLLVEGDAETIVATTEAAKQNAKLASTPIVALADATTQARLSANFEDDTQVTVVTAGQDDLGAAVALATKQSGGENTTTHTATPFTPWIC